MRVFQTNRTKKLDIVIATPGGNGRGPAKPSFAQLAESYGVVLAPLQTETLGDLPSFRSGPTGSVRLALEAKACMTAHIRAIPRLFDELNSSHQTIHGSADVAIAAGFVAINIADPFVSSVLNRRRNALRAPTRSRRDRQGPERVLAKVGEIPRRSRAGEDGFDALGVVFVDMANDGSPVRIVTSPPAPGPGDVLHYSQMIRRIAQLYDFRFR